MAFDEQQIRDRVRTIVTEMAPRPAGTLTGDELLIGDLGYDSLTAFELVAALEGEFSLEPLGDDEAAGIETVADAEDVVLEQLAPAGAAGDGATA